jgi:hypothetical protein
MFNYGHVLWPHVINNMYYNIYIEGLQVSVDYVNQKIVISPGRIYTDKWVVDYPGGEIQFSIGKKWGVVWYDPNDGVLKFTEGIEEEPKCVNPSDKNTCIRPRPPVVNGYAIALVPLWQ